MEAEQVVDERILDDDAEVSYGSLLHVCFTQIS